MRRLNGLWFGFTALLFLSPRLPAQAPVKNATAACSRTHLSDSVSVDHFVFNTYKNDDVGETCLRVVSGGKAVFQRTDDNGGGYTLGQKADAETGAKAIPNGKDITGRGYPDMIVSEYTGGAHCCLIEFVFELEPKFRLLARIDAEDDDLSHFADLDHNGRYYYLTADWTFAYWPSSFASSPSAAIILRYVADDKGGGYHLALDKMRKPAPTAAAWAKQLAQARKTLQEGAWDLTGSGPFWNVVMNLIYSGNSQSAWRLVSEAWPAKRPGREDWAQSFCTILKTSPYYADLDNPLDGAPPACINAKPGAARR